MSRQPARFFWRRRALSCVGVLALAGGAIAYHLWWRVEPATVRPDPPLGIAFFGKCRGVPEGREQVYDPDTGVFHVDLWGYAESGFEVVRADEAASKPVVIHVKRLPEIYGFEGLPLTLAVDGKYYLIDMERDQLTGSVYNLIRDDTLFRVQSKFLTESTVELTVEFTEKGRSLLKPGARIFCVMLNWW